MIYCANNNTLYKQARDACADLCIDETALSRHLSGQRKTVGSYILARVDTQDAQELQDVRRCLLYSAYKIVLDTGEEPLHYERGEKL